MKLIYWMAALLAVTGCQRSAPRDAWHIRIGATAVPHEQILKQVRPFVQEQGVRLEIIPFSDYVQPNVSLAEGDLDANYYQTLPYLQNFRRDRHVNLISLGNVHVEPMGMYARTFRSVAAIPQGAKVALPNDVSNQHRALHLLASAGLITLPTGTDALVSISDIRDNARHLQFVELDAAMLPRALDEADVALINANFALSAGLRPNTDAMLLESAEAPYANLIAARPEDAQRPALQTLMHALHSDATRAYINNTYHGAVLFAPN